MKPNNIDMKEKKDINPKDTENKVEKDEEKVLSSENEETNAQISAEEALENENVALKEALEKEKKEYLFLMAEFDNFRKRTLKEKTELIKNAGESAFKGLLPIVDDFERAIKASEQSEEVESIKEGMDLIYKKLKKYMEQNGVKEMETEDTSFDSDRHEAISVVPVPEESMKGKILDIVEKGYLINEKVLRHAKVVVGQ